MKFNTAIFYDIENLLKGYGFGQRIIQGLSLKDIFKQIQATEAIGKVAIQRAYANWSDARLGFMKNELLELGIEPIQVFGFSYGGNKNVADIQLAVEVTDLVHTHSTLETFVIVSGDGGYASLAKKLHEYGKTVIGCAYEKATNRVFEAVCDNFVWIEDPEGNGDDISNVRITDNRAIKLIDNIFKIDMTYPENEIWDKVKEILSLFQASGEYKNDLESGINPSALRELIGGVIKGFDHTKLGFEKFIEFLKMVFEGTNMSVYTKPPSDVKIAFKNHKLYGYSPLNQNNIKLIANYADIQAQDLRVRRMQRKVLSIKALENQTVVLDKVKEVINWIEKDAEFSTDLRISGCNPAVFKDAVSVSIIGFESIKFGYGRFIEFLRFALRDTSLGIWQSDRLSSDVKVGFRKSPIRNHTLMPDLEPREIHSIECYKSVLACGAPLFKTPDYEYLKIVAIALENSPTKNLVFGEALESIINTQEFHADQESLKLAFTCYISADCFTRYPERASLSEQRLTLKDEYHSYEKLIEKLKSEMQKKILFALEDCKQDVFLKTLE